jgi:hypothetical protein
MNLPALRTELVTLLTNTANLTSTEKQKLRNRAVSEYPSQWAAFLAGQGLTDTAANRGAFLIYLTVNHFWGDIYRAGSNRENIAALSPPEVLE